MRNRIETAQNTQFAHKRNIANNNSNREGKYTYKHNDLNYKRKGHVCVAACSCNIRPLEIRYKNKKLSDAVCDQKSAEILLIIEVTLPHTPQPLNGVKEGALGGL